MPTTGFISQGEPRVWRSAGDLLSPAIAASARQQVNNFVASVSPIDYIKELERIRVYQANSQGSISPLWSEWAASDNVSIRANLDYSSSLKSQRDQCKSLTKAANEAQALPAALMCCDTPQRTVSWLFSSYSRSEGLSFGDMMKHSHRLHKYVTLQLAAAFVAKAEADIQRPSDYQFRSTSAVTVSAIPHPNHESLPSGHSTVGKAVKKYLQEEFGYVPGDVAKACEEVGLARITLGIHWFIDHEAAESIVNALHQEIIDLIGPA